MKQSAFLLLALLGSVAGAVSISGTAVAVSDTAPETRLSAWVVNPAGQPLHLLTDTALSEGFKLTWPDAAPPERTQFVVGNRTAWPGLVDFDASGEPLSASEVKFFVYQDGNKNSKRDENETLREVFLSSGKGSSLFAVWAEKAAVVKGGGGYAADLKAGWNLMNVEMRKGVKVTPYTGGALQLDLSR